MIKTSVIIPIYNVEKYLPRCLDSVINQTLKEIEIICINDESPDNCAKILKKYAKKDKRIIVLNEKNSGQGSARNRGLEIARGKYIQFLDSDDYYEPTCCEEMYQLMEKHRDIDVACFGTNIIYDAYEDQKVNDESYFRMNYTGKTKIKPWMLHQKIDVNCWNKIFRKSFIDKINLRFPEKLHFEDVAFFWFWMIHAKHVYFYPEKLTNYIRRQGSFLGEIYEKSSEVIFDAFHVNNLIYNDLIKNNKWEEYKSVFIASYLLKFNWLSKCFVCNNYQDKRKLIDICSDFLSKFNMDDFILKDSEKSVYKHLVEKNYYVFNAFDQHETEVALPVFSKNSINIVFSADRNYIPYLAVTLSSIIENSSKKNNYDIIILCQDIFIYQKRFILSLCENHPNISIRFFDMKEYIKKFNLDKLFTINHITISAYFRLLVGKIFSNYEKILYLDCDIIVTTDIAELYYTDIGHYPIAAVIDTTISYSLISKGLNEGYWISFEKYMRDTLDFTNQTTYFNSGVMIIDIEKFNETSLDYLIDLAKRNNQFFHDQNVLNAAFEGDYFQLSPAWNFQWNIKFHSSNYKDVLPPELLAYYEDPTVCAKIIHYTSHEKPWKNPYHTFADVWWKYARKTPFYEIFLKDLCKSNGTQVVQKELSEKDIDLILYHHLKLMYWKFRLLSKITFGEKRQKYRQKKKQFKEKIKAARMMMKKYS